MNTKKLKILLLIILILPTFLLTYNLTIKTNTKTTSNSNSIKDLDNLGDTNDSSKNNDIADDIEEDITLATSNDLLTNQNTLKSISIDSYKSNLTASSYRINKGDTVSKIIRNFEDTCNYKTAIKHIKLFNENVNLDELEIDSTLNIPDTALSDGILYEVVSKDTWYRLATSNYPEYDTDDMIEFLISINDLPNSNLPLGQKIFLPKL